MADSGVREVQLSGKQLVFLFMAAVVLLVVVFLLGVTVGRGARGAAVPLAAPTDTVANVAEKPPEPAPGTSTAAGALTAGQRLASASTGAASKAPETPADTTAAPPVNPPAVNPPPAAQPPKTTVAPPAPVSTPAPASTPAKTPVSTSKPAPPAGSWFVQVESFKSKDNAEGLVTKLKAQGFDAYIVDVPKQLLRVRVGPYADRSAAEAARDKLKKDGYSSPLISR